MSTSNFMHTKRANNPNDKKNKRIICGMILFCVCLFSRRIFIEAILFDLVSLCYRGSIAHTISIACSFLWVLVCSSNRVYFSVIWKTFCVNFSNEYLSCAYHQAVQRRELIKLIKNSTICFTNFQIENRIERVNCET